MLSEFTSAFDNLVEEIVTILDTISFQQYSVFLKIVGTVTIIVGAVTIIVGAVTIIVGAVSFLKTEMKKRRKSESFSD